MSPLKKQFYINHASHLNPFVPNASFLNPQKTSENLTVFQGERVHWK